MQVMREAGMSTEQPASSDPISSVKTASIPKESMPIRKFLLHAGIVPSKFAASAVLVGKLVKVNGDRDGGSVRVGDIVTVARLPVSGESVSREPEDVIIVRVVSG